MDWMTPVYLFIALLSVVANGFFVLAEFALVKVRATRIDELARQQDRLAIVAHNMVVQLDDYLATTQLGITVASLGLGWVRLTGAVRDQPGRPKTGDWTVRAT